LKQLHDEVIQGEIVKGKRKGRRKKSTSHLFGEHSEFEIAFGNLIDKKGNILPKVLIRTEDPRSGTGPLVGTMSIDDEYNLLDSLEKSIAEAEKA